MTSVFDEYAEEVAQERVNEAIIRLLKAGASIELVLKAFPSLSIDDIQKLQQKELTGV